jgi:nicotinamidase-related amidase
VNPPVLLVIDMQRDFVDSWQAETRDRLIAAIQKLVTLARHRGWPVIWCGRKWVRTSPMLLSTSAGGERAS